MDPVPGFVTTLEALDGFFQVGSPTFYVTTVLILVALAAGVGLRGEAIPGRAFLALALILGGLALVFIPARRVLFGKKNPINSRFSWI